MDAKYPIILNMPRIVLKPKSPEFADTAQKESPAPCNMPGCASHGEFKAPKHRGLDEYYTFCYDHVKDYNKAWNFFSGMSDHEVEHHVYNSFYGDRPTWKYSGEGTAEENLRDAAEKLYYHEEERPQQNDRTRTFQADSNSPEHEAMAIMGLAPPMTLEKIKERYKILAKKHHPDLNKNSASAAEQLKKINMAYTILKLAFEEYKKLPDAQF